MTKTVWDNFAISADYAYKNYIVQDVNLIVEPSISTKCAETFWADAFGLTSSEVLEYSLHPYYLPAKYKLVGHRVRFEGTTPYEVNYEQQLFRFLEPPPDGVPILIFTEWE